MATKVLTLRLEEDAWREVLAFQNQHRLESPSAAIRMMVGIASKQSMTFEAAFRQELWREGARNMAKKIRDKMDEAVAAALGVA